ncbi:unnamed protein product [Phyllotreta striolata]|uniref:Translin n=1 Tax=Phyllotreta striolata TaxID=444603 RepID=A0A9N9XQ50_PHYSR|nr:unnamed protein product [Phyllotreta striolata]
MCSPTGIVADIFTPFQDYVNSEQETREEIRKIMKDIESPLREIITILQVIHHARDIEQVHAAILSARQTFEIVRKGFDRLDKIVPAGQYYRYNDHWRFATQRLCSLAALIVFLEKGVLINKETTAEILGANDKANIHLDLEDYLIGLLNLATELSRYAVNSVTLGDYQKPLQISRFVAELNAGFRLLNLKNDSLRKRFDALKYDVKKIEEVVYDLSIRGFGQNPVQPINEEPDN